MCVCARVGCGVVVDGVVGGEGRARHVGEDGPVGCASPPLAPISPQEHRRACCAL